MTPLQVEERHRQLAHEVSLRGMLRLLPEEEEHLAFAFAEAEAEVTEAVERREREHYFPLIAALRRIESWTATDLKENGPGPSGGFQLRLDFVRGVLAKAAQPREGGQEGR